MKRIRDNFLSNLEAVLPLKGKIILEVGSGNGERSSTIAAHCKKLIGLEPNHFNLMLARSRGIKNARFQPLAAESLVTLPGCMVDMVLFSLSFHHVAPAAMEQVIDGALHTVTPKGNIVFFEPGFSGSVYEAEVQFDAWDGDERHAKRYAREAMEYHPGLEPVDQFTDVVEFTFDSLDDFLETMKPKKNVDKVRPFLDKLDYKLMAQRTTSIYRPKLKMA